MVIAAFVRIFKLNQSSPKLITVKQAEVGMSYLLGDITIAIWFIKKFLKKVMKDGQSESDDELTEDLDSSDMNGKKEAKKVIEEIDLDSLLQYFIETRLDFSDSRLNMSYMHLLQLVPNDDFVTHLSDSLKKALEIDNLTGSDETSELETYEGLKRLIFVHFVSPAV